MDNKVFDIAPAPKSAVKQKAEPTKKVVQDNDDGPLSIPVRTSMIKSVPEVQQPSENVPVQPEMHHDLKLDIPKEKEAVAEPEQHPEADQVLVTGPSAPENKNVETQQPVTDKIENHVEAGAELTTTEEIVAAAPQPKQEAVLGDPDAADTELQSPKIFDTKQYHLPIKENHAKSAGKHMVTFMVVFLLLVLLGGVIAIDAGWLDLGVKLPFDLIK